MCVRDCNSLCMCGWCLYASNIVVRLVISVGELVFDQVSLPEWSEGLRSGRSVFERVGSNPTADNAQTNSRFQVPP